MTKTLQVISQTVTAPTVKQTSAVNSDVNMTFCQYAHYTYDIYMPY